MKEIFKYFKIYHPKLKRIGRNGVYQKLGCLVVGIEFEKSRNYDGYYPYFVLFGLWGKDVSNYRAGNEIKNCFNSPDIHIRLLKNTGEPILLENQNLDFQMRELYNQLNTIFPLESDVNINSIIKLIEDYKYHFNILAKGSGAMAILLEFKFLLSLAIEDFNLQKSTLNEIENSRKEWNMSQFENRIDDYDQWLNTLKKLDKKDIDKSSNYIIDNSKILTLNTFNIV
jgi:hypothetical protein